MWVMHFSNKDARIDMAYHQLLPGEIDVVNRSTDGDGTLPDGRNVRVSRIGEQDRGVRTLHDQLQSYVALKILKF